MADTNKLAGVVRRINSLPSFARSKALTLLFGKAIPFTGTAGLKVESIDANNCVITLENKRRVQNHIGGIHACASLLLAETATGLLAGINIPDDKVPVVKSVTANYTRRAKGDMRVVAKLTDEQRQRMLNEDKGDVDIKVTVMDSEEKIPIEVTMIWAWTPKKR